MKIQINSQAPANELLQQTKAISLQTSLHRIILFMKCVCVWWNHLGPHTDCKEVGRLIGKKGERKSEKNKEHD